MFSIRLIPIALFLLSPVPAQADFNLTSLGSGFFISPDHVLTNAHVVLGCSSLTVAHQDQDWFTAKLVAADPAADLAVVVTSQQSSSPAVFDSSLDTVDATNLAAIGFPNLGRPTIRPVRSPLTTKSSALETAEPVYLINGEIHPGSSGSPVLDSNGLVVGVIAQTIDTVLMYQREGRLIDDIGRAISNASVMRFLSAHKLPFIARSDLHPVNSDEQLEVARSFVVQIGCWK